MKFVFINDENRKSIDDCVEFSRVSFTLSLLLMPFYSLLFTLLFFGVRIGFAVGFALLPCFALYILRLLLIAYFYRSGGLSKEDANFWIIYAICLCFGVWIGLKMLKESFYGQCITIYILLEPLLIQFMSLPRMMATTTATTAATAPTIKADDVSFMEAMEEVEREEKETNKGEEKAEKEKNEEPKGRSTTDTTATVALLSLT